MALFRLGMTSPRLRVERVVGVPGRRGGCRSGTRPPRPTTDRGRMPQSHRARRTLLPIALLLGGLLGTGPFVPHTLGADSTKAASGALDVAGLAGWLGLALAVAALAMVAVARRDEQATKAAEAARAREHSAAARGTRTVDPLVAALRGAAAFAPDDLDARLTASTGATAAHPITRDAPPWLRRIAPAPAAEELDDVALDDRTSDLADTVRA